MPAQQPQPKDHNCDGTQEHDRERIHLARV
jgi:hypothetical protein